MTPHTIICLSLICLALGAIQSAARTLRLRNRTIHSILCALCLSLQAACLPLAATTSTILDEHGLYGIYDMWHKPWWQRRTYQLIALALIVLSGILLLITIIRWYVARKKKVILSSWEQALLDMQKIKPSVLFNKAAAKSGLSDKVDAKSVLADKIRSTPVSLDKADTKQIGAIFYVEISKILKKYLHERLAYPIKNSTDQETIAYVQAVDLNPEITDMIIEILNGGQYVKFAGQKIIKENMERHFNMGIEIIQKTIPNLSK